MKLRINSINEAKIKAVHDDLEGPQDNKHIVLSMPMEMFVKMQEIDALVGCFEGQSVEDFYWIKDEAGNSTPRYKNLAGQQLVGVHNNGVLVIGNETINNCRLTKARFTPWEGDQAKLTCTISVINPKQKDLDGILKFKGCSLPISFVGDMALFEDTEPEPETQTDMLDAEPEAEGIEQEDLSEADLSELDDEVVEEPADEVEEEIEEEEIEE